MNWAQHPVVQSLAPVFLLIGAGWLAGRLGWIRESALRDLSNLVFLLLIPSLLFRTMSQVRLEQLDWRPIAAYFPAAVAWLGLSIAWRGWRVASVVQALGGVFSNMVMIGITLVGLAYGQAGLVTLLTLVSVHSLILLTVASVTLELLLARDVRRGGGGGPRWWVSAASALRSALLHPVPLPIVCGLAFAQTGWALPTVLDKPLQLLGSAFGPVSLVLVGVSLAATPLAGHWRGALWLTVSKNLAFPLLVAACAGWMGLRGLPLQVVVVAAALPTGANVFLFAQRYRTEEALTTAAMGVSTALALFTLSAWMLFLPGFER